MRRRGFLRNEQGIAIIEFGLLAPIFLYLVLVLIDLSMFFVTRSIVDDSVENGARAVRLGVLSLKDGGAGFRTALCSNLVMLDCNNFSFSVSVPSDLTAVDLVPAIDTTTGAMKDKTYAPGNANDIAVVTIVYVHHFLTPYSGAIFGDTTMINPMTRAIVSYLVVKNEPFPDNSGN